MLTANITAMWYDSLNRVVTTASYGTYAGALFDRDTVTSAPTASSSTVLVSKTAYDRDGTVLETTDPKGIKARTLKDDAGRTLASIANYVDGTPGGMSGMTAIENDEDQVTRYEYTNGQMTKMIADRPSGFTDQETVYTYGVTKGTGTNQSSISSNRLLYTVLYPQGSYTDASDRLVTYAYNAQGQQRRVLDQAGNAITTTYDRAGREVSRGIGVVTGYVDDVKRIDMTYNPRGMVNTVTQYDAATGGNALDEVRYQYDDWGNLTYFDQDVDSTFAGSSGGRWGVAYAFGKATPTGAGQNLRRTSQTLPGGASIAYGYGTANGVDDSLSRVAKISVGTTDLAEYQYLGSSQVVGTHLPEAGQKYNAYTSTTPSAYANLDVYGRVIRSEWEKTGGGAPAYAVQIAYDYNSNITRVQDQLRSLEQMSALYTMDNLNRVVTADQGKLVESSGNYTVDDDWRWRKETWTLSQTGNWLAHNVGTNSSANNALVETGTFNTANEWTARSRTVPGTASDTLVYDKVGNLVNDGKGLAYKYDGLGRLREVRLTGESNRLKTAYRYNGLGMRITHAINMSAGTSDDDVTDAGDPVTYFAYDERWRVAGAWVSDANTTPSSSTPTERWIHHAAGIGGRGGSSYIDSVVLRDRDVVTSGGSASSTSDGGSDALEERIYVLQNWRADVVATVGRTGTLIEWMQYTAYGSAITNPPGNADFNGDGGVDGSDTEAFFVAYAAGLLSADVNNDGSVTGDDVEAFDEIWDAGLYPTPGLCSFTAIRIGYAGYQWDGSVNIASERAYTGAMAGLYHVRHRVYDPELGRWTRRDPVGYVDGLGLYAYVQGKVVERRDGTGLGPIIDEHLIFPGIVVDGPGLNERSCAARLAQAQTDPRVLALQATISATCPGAALPTIGLITCGDSGVRGEFSCSLWGGGETIGICWGGESGGFCPHNGEMVDTLLHELTHFRQFCSAGPQGTPPGGGRVGTGAGGQPGSGGSCWDWTLRSPTRRMWFEIEAYCAERNSRCPPTNPADARDLCLQVDASNFGGGYCQCMAALGFPCRQVPPPDPMTISPLFTANH